MSGSDQRKDGQERGPDLGTALHRARVAHSGRLDAIAEIQSMEQARLQVLSHELAPIFEQIPDGNDQFMLSLVPSNPPRLWLDMAAFVELADDKHAFRLVQDSREGRRVLMETSDRVEMAGAVTDYVAHRLVERERSLEPRSPSLGAGAGGYSTAALILAWICGFVVAALGIFIAGLLAAGQP